MSSSDDNVKKKCPYMEKCYRKNPIHFNEMSHPHLEKLVVNQLDDEIRIPDNLQFECTDRSLLLDQLKILQMIFKKKKNNSGKGFLTMTSTQATTPKTPNAVDPNSSGCASDSLKDKVEKHKQLMIERRENKLQEMDKRAEALSKPSTSNGNREMETKKVSKMRKELDNLKIEEEKLEKNYPTQGRKRNHNDSNDSPLETKKNKSSDDYTSNESATSDDSSSSSPGVSLIEMYETCNSEKSRDEVRKKAIEMMKRQNLKVSVVNPGEFALKYALSAPYHIFFTRIENSKATHNQQFSITFPEILDRSLGEIVCTLQINFMVDVGWLCLQYLLAGQRTDMLILYGERVDEEKLSPNIKMIPIQMPSSFGCHHSKIMVIKYKDKGIRVVVSTANLYSCDWENRTQGLWISPHLPPLPEGANSNDGESPTGFKRDFKKYLSKYKLPALAEWISLVQRADFSAVDVFLVASVPGSHKDAELNSWGHKKLGLVLSKHASLPPDAPQWPIVAQSSSIGSLGPNYESWLLKQIVPAMSMETTKGLKSHPNFHFIYPTINNYKDSFDCRVGSCCLPYSLQTHSKQVWFESYMHQWKASRTARDKGMPHIKSYARFSPDFKKISWFVLTSANLSKAAWGNCRVSNYIMSYEAGVVFIPQIITKTATFPIQEEEVAGVPVFPIMYDVPLTRYGPEDKPFVMEFFNQ